MTALSPTTELACRLIERPSMTPTDSGCQMLLAERLARSGFSARHLDFNHTSNVLIRHGDSAPLMVFLGHTDVVPPGPEALWTSAPFDPQVRDGKLYGRGACDMKGAVAAFTVAAERFVTAHPQHSGSLGLLLTSDEEIGERDGIERVMQVFDSEKLRIDWCLGGEPTAEQHLGDTVKIGRRGSINAVLTIYGVQGHIAYPHNADNPILRALPALNALAETTWDSGNEHFQPTGWQISSIAAGTGAANQIPGEISIHFNFRYATEQTSTGLKDRVTGVLDNQGLTYDLQWHDGSLPFLSTTGDLLVAVREAVHQCTGTTPKATTSGGTSDARHLGPRSIEVVELGLVNESAHSLDEWAETAALDRLTDIYQRVLVALLT